jgi:hypothetical protein
MKGGLSDALVVGLSSECNQTFLAEAIQTSAVIANGNNRPKHVIRQALVHANVSSGYQTLDHANRLVFFGHHAPSPRYRPFMTLYKSTVHCVEIALI